MNNNVIRIAWVNWSATKKAWLIRLWTEDGWETGGIYAGLDKDGDGSTWVRDDILCRIASLQAIGYIVRITV